MMCLLRYTDDVIGEYFCDKSGLWSSTACDVLYLHPCILITYCSLLIVHCPLLSLGLFILAVVSLIWNHVILLKTLRLC